MANPRAALSPAYASRKGREPSLKIPYTTGARARAASTKGRSAWGSWAPKGGFMTTVSKEPRPPISPASRTSPWTKVISAPILAAFRLAADQKTDYVELDVQESADGEVVVVHDRDERLAIAHEWPPDSPPLSLATAVVGGAGVRFSVAGGSTKEKVAPPSGLFCAMMHPP